MFRPRWLFSLALYAEINNYSRRDITRGESEPMRKLIVLIFLTLDGVMQSDDGPEVDRSFGFTYGGWSTPYFDDFLEQTLAVPDQ